MWRGLAPATNEIASTGDLTVLPSAFTPGCVRLPYSSGFALRSTGVRVSCTHWPQPGMQTAAVRIGAQGRRGFLVPAGHGSHAQHLLSGARPKSDAIGARGGLPQPNPYLDVTPRR